MSGPGEHPPGKNSGIGTAILIVMLLACLQLPFSSFMADDFILLGQLEKVSSLPGSAPFSLYTLADGDAVRMQQAKESGAFPWFFHPRFKLNFFRPLSSALYTLDHRLFGLHPLGYAIHSLVWLIVLVAGVGILHRWFLPGPSGRLATMLYALSGILAITAFWTACRHNLIAPALGVWAFLAHLRWQEKRQAPFLFLSLAGFASAFLAGEAAVAMLAYPVAAAGLAPESERKKRILSLLPLLALTLGYLAFYSACGYGAGSGSEYQNPLSDPGGFLHALPQRLAATAAFLFVGSAADVPAFDPASRPFLAIAGLFFTLLLVFLFRRSRSSLPPRARQPFDWLLAGALLSSLPFAASMTISFHLVVPFIGWSAVIARILHSRPSIVQGSRGWKRPAFQAGCALLFFFHLILAPLLRMTTPPFLKKMMFSRVQSAMQKLDRDFLDLAGMHAVVLDAPDIAIGFHSYFYRRLYRLPMPASWRVLHWGENVAAIRRVAANALEMEWKGGETERRGVRPGASIHLSDIEVTVATAPDAAGQKITCVFDRPLDDHSLILLIWRDGRLQATRIPGIGKPLEPRGRGT